MPITLPDSFRPRLEPIAREAGTTVDQVAAHALEYWLSWKEAQPALDEALNDRLAEPLTSDDFEALRREVRGRHPGASGE
jgi:hypothetical protein